MTTPTGIEWTSPTGVPETCFPQYIISLTADPTVTLTVDDTTASSAALNAAAWLPLLCQSGDHSNSNSGSHQYTSHFQQCHNAAGDQRSWCVCSVVQARC